MSRKNFVILRAMDRVAEEKKDTSKKIWPKGGIPKKKSVPSPGKGESSGASSPVSLSISFLAVFGADFRKDGQNTRIENWLFPPNNPFLGVVAWI